MCVVPVVVGTPALGQPRLVGNPLAIENHKTDEFVNTSHRCGSLPIEDISNLFIFHFKTILTNVDS